MAMDRTDQGRKNLPGIGSSIPKTVGEGKRAFCRNGHTKGKKLWLPVLKMMTTNAGIWHIIFRNESRKPVHNLSSSHTKKPERCNAQHTKLYS